jgi:hypothetical protein
MHAMPIQYERDDQRRLIIVRLAEPYSLDALLNQTDRQWAERTWDYAVLYDSRATSHVTPTSELQLLVDYTHFVGGGQPRGPVGVAIPPRPEFLRGGLQLARLGGPLREIEILLNETQIEDWLVRHAPRRGPSDQP